MSFLCTFGLCLEVTGMYVVFSHHFRDSLFASYCFKIREVDRVRTHISDKSRFVQALCKHHGLRNGISQFTCSFLLQRRSGERCRRCFLYRTGSDIFDCKSGSLTSFEESSCFFLRLDATCQFRFHLHRLAICVRNEEYGGDAISGFCLEGMYFTFTLYNQTNSNRLNTSGREGRFYFSPEYR